VVDGDLRYLGSLRTQSGTLVPCPAGFDAADGLTLALMYEIEDPLSGSSRYVPACGLVRLLGQRTEVTGVIIGPGRSACWKDTDNDGAFEIVFWKFVRARPGQVQVMASVKLDPNGVPITDALPADGSVLVWTPPDGVPLPIPEDVKAEDFFRQLLPLPDGFGTSPTSAPTSTRSSTP
jgi:hypothetical protein